MRSGGGELGMLPLSFSIVKRVFEGRWSFLMRNTRGISWRGLARGISEGTCNRC